MKTSTYIMMEGIENCDLEGHFCHGFPMKVGGGALKKEVIFDWSVTV